MNDTTRQIGGALGVAVLGSVFSSAYTSGFGQTLTGLPSKAAAAVQSSVGGALVAAKRIGGAPGAELAATATRSFVHAMDRALVVGAGIALVSALVALVWLPNRAEPDAEELRHMEDVYAGHHAAPERDRGIPDVGPVERVDG